VLVWAPHGWAAVCVARGGACAWRAPVGEMQAGTGHAWVHGGARLVAMGGGEHGARGWLPRTRRDIRRGVQGDREHGVPLSWRLCARPTRPRRGHGGAAILGTAASGGVGTKRGQRPGIAFKATAHACWGARLRVPRPARARARGHACDADATWAHRHGATASYG
jgi:hypothetical protein